MMWNSVINMFDRCMKTGAEIFLTVERHENPHIETHRKSTCLTCPFYRAARDKCIYCGCYIEVKSKLKTNINPKKLDRLEITHCPKAKWPGAVDKEGNWLVDKEGNLITDIEITNYYRELDGKELLIK